MVGYLLPFAMARINANRWSESSHSRMPVSEAESACVRHELRAGRAYALSGEIEQHNLCGLDPLDGDERFVGDRCAIAGMQRIVVQPHRAAQNL